MASDYYRYRIELPKNRTGKVIIWLDKRSSGQLFLIGILIYVAIVFVISSIEYLFHVIHCDLVFDGNNGIESWLDILYFNFITILTVGYGDFHPVGYGKLLSIFEAFLGVALFGMIVAIITVKSLLPPQNIIVFSKYAYYCTEEERFLIIYLNTTDDWLPNCDISSYFKLGGDWGVGYAIRTPVITRAVQTFFIDKEFIQNILSKLIIEKDCLRVGITGYFGFAQFSTYIEYEPKDIIIIPNRDELIEYEGFRKPDFSSDEFKTMFHYKPEQALTLQEYVNQTRGLQ